MESNEVGEELANIGFRGFQEYVNSTILQELKVDAELADWYRRTDHSRVNTAFKRWQKRVYADLDDFPVENLTSRGQWAPRLEGLEYTWPDLYNSSAFSILRRRLSELSRQYLRRTGYTDLPKKFRIFVWVEVFQKGDALAPSANTDGAFLMGRYYAMAPPRAVKQNFEDPRGINPPFGKTHSMPAVQGYVILFPAWASHLITPSMVDQPVVCYSFLVYPPTGNTLNWQEDLTSQMAVVGPIRLRSDTRTPSRR